jgi:hypothetical protein
MYVYTTLLPSHFPSTASRSISRYVMAVIVDGIWNESRADYLSLNLAPRMAATLLFLYSQEIGCNRPIQDDQPTTYGKIFAKFEELRNTEARTWTTLIYRKDLVVEFCGCLVCRRQSRHVWCASVGSTKNKKASAGFIGMQNDRRSPWIFRVVD